MRRISHNARLLLGRPETAARNTIARAGERLPLTPKKRLIGAKVSKGREPSRSAGAADMVQHHQRRFVRCALIAAALSTAAIAPAPAFAGGGHRQYDRNYSRHYDYGQYGNRRYTNDRHRRGRISGGEAALIAAGIIGGVILIDQALDNRERDDDRYDRRYDDRYSGGGFDDSAYYRRDERYDDRYSDDGYDRAYDDDVAVERRDGDLDDILLGDEDLSRRSTAGRPHYADIAFRECVAEARGAAGQGGLTVAMPAAPDRMEELADGSVRMSASFRASNARGDEWARRFVCEADEEGVRFLQVD